MPRHATRVTCRGCRKITEFPIDAISPFHEDKLVCGTCGARDPEVVDVEIRRPFECGYGANGCTSVTVLKRRK